jgi:hypothetical protein
VTFVQQQGEWCEVRYQDPEFGLRAGWIRTNQLRIERTGSQPTAIAQRSTATLAPVAPATVPPPPRAESQANSLTGGDGQAAIPADYVPEPRRSNRSVPNRVFVDADFLVLFPQQDALTLTASRPIAGGATSVLRANYAALPRSENWFPLPTVRVMLGHKVGIGARYVARNYNEFPGLFVQAPRPLQSTLFSIDSDVGSVLERKDWMLDFNVQYLYAGARWRGIVLGGPTVFHTKAEMVRTITYTQPATTGLVNITGFVFDPISGTAWGFNVGGDLSYFPWKHVGFGGGATLNNGQLTITDPLSNNATDLTVGALSVIAGPRFRF